MIFNKKNIFKNILVWVLFFIVFDSNLNATTAEDIEKLTALMRIPVAISTNTVGKQGGVTPKVILIASDLIRLSNEMLSIMNKRERYDFHVFDYCWSAYDAKNLITHVKNFWNQKGDEAKNNVPKEIEKLEAKIQSLHELVLPVVEGFSAFLQSTSTLRGANNLQDQQFRNRCRAICSLSRLVDNLIISKSRSAEYYAYIILVLANIVIALSIEGVVDVAIVEQKIRRRREEGVARHVSAVHMWDDLPGVGDLPDDVGVVPDDTDEEHFRNIGGQIAAKDHSAAHAVVNDETFLDGDCSVCLCPFVPGERARRFVCGHVLHHCSKNGHEDCFGQLSQKKGLAEVCPICNGKRDEGRETDITIKKK
ncbi:MAG: RING finger protein [bacterium]